MDSTPQACCARSGCMQGGARPLPLQHGSEQGRLSSSTTKTACPTSILLGRASREMVKSLWIVASRGFVSVRSKGSHPCREHLRSYTTAAGCIRWSLTRSSVRESRARRPYPSFSFASPDLQCRTSARWRRASMHCAQLASAATSHACDSAPILAAACLALRCAFEFRTRSHGRHRANDAVGASEERFADAARGRCQCPY